MHTMLKQSAEQDRGRPGLPGVHSELSPQDSLRQEGRVRGCNRLGSAWTRFEDACLADRHWLVSLLGTSSALPPVKDDCPWSGRERALLSLAGRGRRKGGRAATFGLDAAAVADVRRGKRLTNTNQTSVCPERRPLCHR